MTRRIRSHLYPTSNLYKMKKFIVSCSAFAFAFCALNVSAQDAEPLQPKGTWYLGSADATSLFKMFSAEGVDVAPFVGYTVADNIAISLGLNMASATIDGVDGASDMTMSSSQVSVGAAYFFGDNFYGQAQVVLGNSDDGVNDAQSSTGYGVGLGKYIPVKDMWFISPQLNYTGGSNDLGSSSGAEIRIQFGASF